VTHSSLYGQRARRPAARSLDFIAIELGLVVTEQGLAEITWHHHVTGPRCGHAFVPAGFDVIVRRMRVAA
jgi:hypothetical protein